MSKTPILLEKINNAKSLDFGFVFNKSIELFKKVWLQGLVSYLLNMVLMIPLMFVIYIPLIFLGILSPESFGENIDLNGYSIFVIIIIVALAITIFVLLATVTLGLKAAFFRIIKNKDLGLNISDDYFFFLKKNYLKKTLTLGLSLFGMFILAYALCVLPVLYIIVPAYYMVVIYAMNPDMPNSEIIKTGFALGNKKWFITFGLLFVSWVLSMLVGFLMCFVGVYVTQQFIDLPAYLIYKEVIGFDEKTEIEQIGVL